MNYNYLKTNSPNIIVEAIKYIGIKEILGKQHNPIIMQWAKELGLQNVYTSDEIPWCGLYVAIVCKRADKEVVINPLWARNWLKFGTKQPIAMLGDILVFERGSGGHVGFYVGEDSECYHVLGGNQGNMVSVTRILKTRCIGIRRSKWKIAQPTSVRTIALGKTGEISTNES
jgi:uncharacterized protein (TIGR02594 family)